MKNIKISNITHETNGYFGEARSGDMIGLETGEGIPVVV